MDAKKPSGDAQTFEKLPCPGVIETERGLGRAFGGSDKAHISHLRTLALTTFPKGLDGDFRRARQLDYAGVAASTVTQQIQACNTVHAASTHKYAAMSFADAVVFYSKLERPQNQRCIHWDPNHADMKSARSPQEQVWREEFFREMRETGLFHLPVDDRKVNPAMNGGLSQQGTDDLYFTHPVEYLWEAVRIKHGHLMVGEDSSARARASDFLNEIPEVFDGKLHLIPFDQGLTADKEPESNSPDVAGSVARASGKSDRLQSSRDLPELLGTRRVRSSVPPGVRSVLPGATTSEAKCWLKSRYSFICT